MKIACLSHFTVFENRAGYRAPLVAGLLETLKARGHQVIYLAPEQFTHDESPVPAIGMPDEDFGLGRLWAAWGREYLRARRLPVFAPQPSWLRPLIDFSPDLAVGMNGSGLLLASLTRQATGCRVLPMDIGGFGYRQALYARGAFVPALFQYYLPHHLHIDGLLAIDDTTHPYAATAAERIPAERQCYLPIPHRHWRQWDSSALARFSLPQRKAGPRIVWAANPSASKRPWVFLETARALSRLGLGLDLIMVSGQPGSLESAIGDDPVLRSQFTHVPTLSNDALEALIESSDLAVFTSYISVAGTIFRETVDAGIPVATTVDPVDSLLINLLDTTRDVVVIDPRNPEASARAIARALADRAALAEMGRRAQAKMRARGMLMDEYLERAAPFVEKIATMPPLTSSFH